MKNRIKVYIASPYTKGDVDENVRRQMIAMDILMNYGFVPFIPLLYHFQDMSYQRPYQDWLNLCLEWVKVCDCVLRLKGESPGADSEVAFAKKLGIPVFHTIVEIKEHYKL